MGVVSYFFLFSAVILIALTQFFDFYTYYIKGSFLKNTGRSLVAYGNWVQYISRIFYVIGMFILSILLERYNFSDGIQSVILFGLSLGLLLSIIFKFKSSFEPSVRFFLYPFIFFNFKGISSRSYWSEVSLLSFGSKLSVAVFVSTFLIESALLAPFVFASIFPEFRMTAAYSGQLLNFVATVIVVSYVDPRIFSKLDAFEFSGAETPVVGELIAAKIYAQSVVVLLLSLLVFS